MSEKQAKTPSTHTLDLRISIPWIFGRSYFVFLAGRDRRGEKADFYENEKRQNTPWGWAFFAGTFLLWTVFAALLASIVFLYVFKSWAGIDLVEGASPLQSILHTLKVCHNIRR